MADSSRQERAQEYVASGRMAEVYKQGNGDRLDTQQVYALYLADFNQQEERILAEKIVAEIRERASHYPKADHPPMTRPEAIRKELDFVADELERTYCPEPEAEVIRCDAYACPICGVHAKPCSHFGIDYGLTPSRGVYSCNECGESDTPCEHYCPEPEKESDRHG